MYRIAVDTGIFEYMTHCCNITTEQLHITANSIRYAAAVTEESHGFGIDIIAEMLRNEAVAIENLCDDFVNLCSKTNRISEIYQAADKDIRRDVEELPVLIHGNISSKGRTAELLEYSVMETEYSNNIVENALVYDNTVMHEDWLIQLTAENKYNG